ncbi:MAG: DUF2184 domain-containing protein [Chloroflexota bacterium]|nr:DUF2184 domain-containing protein [Chloroflexota bacterium]
MKSVFFRNTGKLDTAGREVREPVFLSNRHTAHKSVYVNGDPASGLDLRFNAAAATAEQATGYQILTDTLTYIKQQESTQTYYELGGKKPSDFVPVAVGEGAWAGNILTRRVYQNAGDFESGLVRQGSHDARKTASSVSMDSVSIPTFLWEDGVEYNLMEIEQSLMASNWDIVAAKHAARHKKFQLGVQAITFLGTKSGSMEGLLNTTKVNVNTSFITAAINSLNASGFSTFVAGLIQTYFANANATVLPNRFVIPMSDYLGLQVLVPGSAGTFPVSMFSYLENAFKALCGSDFQIVGNAYADATYNNALRGLNKQVYALYRYDDKTLRMDIPVDFTVTQPNSLDNFNFQDTAYAQITGVGFYKPLEVLLFQY